MFAQAVIDSLEFARTEQSVHGVLPISSLARLQDALHDAVGQVEVDVRGGTDAQLRPVLDVTITGALHLRCQRCLGRLEYPVRVENALLLVTQADADGGEFDELEVDWIVASRELNLAELIEDELILSIPYSPRHAEGQCAQQAVPTHASAESMPFAKLAELKKSHH